MLIVWYIGVVIFNNIIINDVKCLKIEITFA